MGGKGPSGRSTTRLTVRRLMAGGGGLLLLALPMRTAGAESLGVNFSATAVAEGVRVSYDVPNFVLVSTFVDGAAPIASAVLESSGTSRSFASQPYPGSTAVAGPGIVAGFGGPNLPDYPFFVTA